VHASALAGELSFCLRLRLLERIPTFELGRDLAFQSDEKKKRQVEIGQ
jgi:hypothetical protein